MGKLGRMLDLIYPLRCPFCGRSSNEIPCKECEELLLTSRSELYLQTQHCDDCRAPFYYTCAVRKAVIEFKYRRKVGYGRSFAQLLQEAVPKKKFDLLCSVPSHKQGKQEYNSSEILASELARRLQLSYVKRAIRKCKKTKRQHELTYEQRLTNLQSSFSVKKKLVFGKRILLCDDVMTTGSTVEEISRVCLEAGAEEVCAVAIAMSVSYKKNQCAAGSVIRVKRWDGISSLNPF